jgi:hypothetical protein
MSRPVTIAAVVAALFVTTVPALAQRAIIPATLTDQDVRWLNDYCSKRGSAPGTEAHKRCFDAKAKEILDQREADQRYRPNPV